MDESISQSLTFRLDDCSATPTADPNNTVTYQLVQDGCAEHSWIDVTSDSLAFNFFAFYGEDEVYVHCGVKLCASHLSEDCEMPTAEECSASGNDASRRKRRSDDKKNVSQKLIH